MIYLFELITVGLPFAGFKIITGLHLDYPWLTLLGGIDLVFNSGNIFTQIIFRNKKLPTCFAALLSQIICYKTQLSFETKEDIGNSVDMFFSFTLVAYMIGTGTLPLLSPHYLHWWNLSVILNVLGAGIQRLHLTFTSLAGTPLHRSRKNS